MRFCSQCEEQLLGEYTVVFQRMFAGHLVKKGRLVTVQFGCFSVVIFLQKYLCHKDGRSSTSNVRPRD